MSKKKKKAPPTEAKEGTILMFATSISEAEFEAMKKLLAKIPCDFSAIIRAPCDVIKFEESYWGPCPRCREEIYTRDFCPVCGEFIDMS